MPKATGLKGLVDISAIRVVVRKREWSIERSSKRYQKTLMNRDILTTMQRESVSIQTSGNGRNVQFVTRVRQGIKKGNHAGTNILPVIVKLDSRCVAVATARITTSAIQDQSTAGLVRPWQKALKRVVLYPEISKMHDRVRRDEKNALKRAKRRALNVSIPTYIPRHLQEVKYCVDCGSTTTSKNIKGNPNWYRIEVPIGPIGYLDNNCFRKRVRRLKREAKGLPVLVSRKGETDSEKRERLNALQWAKRQSSKASGTSQTTKAMCRMRFL